MNCGCLALALRKVTFLFGTCERDRGHAFQLFSRHTTTPEGTPRCLKPLTMHCESESGESLPPHEVGAGAGNEPACSWPSQAPDLEGQFLRSLCPAAALPSLGEHVWQRGRRGVIFVCQAKNKTGHGHLPMKTDAVGAQTVSLM